jgi:hypothetical protein
MNGEIVSTILRENDLTMSTKIKMCFFSDPEILLLEISLIKMKCLLTRRMKSSGGPAARKIYLCLFNIA